MIQKKFYFITWLYSILFSVLIALLLSGIMAALNNNFSIEDQLDFLMLVLLFTIPFSLPGLLFFLVITWNFQFWSTREGNYFYVIITGLISVLFSYLVVHTVLNINMFSQEFWKIGVPGLCAVIISLFITKKQFLIKKNIPFLI